MKKSILPLVLIVGITVLSLQSCLNDMGIVPTLPETFCDSLDVSYNIDVKPLALANCATPGCHEPNGGAPGDFTTYTALSGASASVAERIQLPVSNSLHMPQGGVLSQDEINIFLCWIEKGAPNN